jgi:hypothetical protein
MTAASKATIVLGCPGAGPTCFTITLFASCSSWVRVRSVSSFGEDRPQSFWQVRVGILDEGPHERHDLTCTHRDEHAQLAQQSPQGVEPGRALRHPARAQTVQRREDLLVHGLHGDGPDVLVAAHLQDALGVRAIGLVAADVGSYVMRRQKHPRWSSACSFRPQ